jgi:hypothetical protein
MGFKIFANGTPKFHYESDKNLDGDDFKWASVLANFTTTTPTLKGAVPDVIGAVTPSAGIGDLMGAVAQREMVHLIDIAVSSLAMKATEGSYIFVSCRQTHLLWPDTMGTGRYTFDPGDNPGPEFLKAIKTALKDTDFATWGALAGLAKTLGKYDAACVSDPRLMIQLSH